MLRKKNDDNDVVQGGYVGENRDPDYRRYEQASQSVIMTIYYHYYHYILYIMSRRARSISTLPSLTLSKSPFS